MRRARLAAVVGLAPGASCAPASLDLTREAPWPLARACRTREPQLVSALVDRFGALPGGLWPEPPREALVLPIAASGQERIVGALVAGVSARRVLDAEYRSFLALVAGQIAAGIASARARDEERRRARALAELDRAKTRFFSSVSHEFRTPLTLMLGPVEHALGAARPSLHGEELRIVHRNGLRLQKLVTALVDFSRIEAGRMTASFEPTDLAALTADLASSFRSLVERGGLTLEVACPLLPTPVFVDRAMRRSAVLMGRCAP